MTVSPIRTIVTAAGIWGLMLGLLTSVVEARHVDAMGTCNRQAAADQDKQEERQGQDAEDSQEQEGPGPLGIVDEITVIGVTPIGAGIDLDKVAASIQVMEAEAIAQSRARDLSDLLQRGFGGVHVVEVQGNLLQPDVHFRGYGASPLLGSPQGLSVYQDGVRLNELFGDTVHWDLVPVRAIASLELISGSNPLFGLNTQGGSISIRTKSGQTYQGHSLRARAGSFGQGGLSLETGGGNTRLGYYVTGNLMAEDGWRNFSPSRIRSLFGKLSWHRESLNIDASLTMADNRLQGNGAAPVELLDDDRSAVFTHPDITDTALLLASVGARTELAEGAWLEGSAYFRGNDIGTFNADAADFDACEVGANIGLLCFEDHGEQVVLNIDANPVKLENQQFDAINNTSTTQQRGYGAALQTSRRGDLLGGDHHLVLGASYDGGRSRFNFASELASLSSERSTQGHGVNWLDSLVRVRARNRNIGLFATNILTVAPRLSLMLSGRYNDTGIKLLDDLRDDLDGDHLFRRLNFSGGVTIQASKRLWAFGGYAESSRAPTPVELTCADPADPCRLPNSFVADPPLEQVVTRTWEAGLRARLPQAAFRAVVFRSLNRDDILFVSSGPLRGQGFFRNIEATQRFGFELGVSGRAGGTVGWFAEYMFLRPTFNAAVTVPSPDHPLAIGGEIHVVVGDVIPGIPKHNFKTGLTVRVGRALDLGLDLVLNSGRHLRGDEANLLAPLSGFTLLNAMAAYSLRGNLMLYVKVNNLLDVEYETFGVLGDPGELFSGEFDDPRFLGPGAPRSIQMGLEWNLGR